MNWISNFIRAFYHRYEKTKPPICDPLSSERQNNIDQAIDPQKVVLQDNNYDPVSLGFVDRENLDIDLNKEKAIVERIFISYQKMKVAQKMAPAPYQPSHKWGPEIEKRRSEYLEVLRIGDIAALTKLFRNFYRNSGSYALLKYLPFQDLMGPSDNQRQLLDDFYQNICSDFEVWKEYAEDHDLGQLTIPLIGNPYGCVIDGQLITPASCCHNYYYQRVKSIVENITEPVIAEIGAGFGGMAYFLLNSGKKLHYIDFDLPEILIIAEYFLLTALPDKTFLLFGEQQDNDLSVEAINKYEIILMPNFQMLTLPNNSIDIFINTHSLSEMDYPTVEEYVSQITRTCRKFFFHENSEMKVDIGYGNLEITASSFPIPRDRFIRIYKLNALWREPRYREYLYMKK